MPEAAYLYCPLLGTLKVRQRAKDGLTFTEEKTRIDALRFLLQRGYPRENFDIEPTVLRFGHKGRNSLRPDFSVYDEPADSVRRLPEERRLDRVRLIGEVKRDHSDAAEAKALQLRPVLPLLPDNAYGVYWDEIEQRFFYHDSSKRTWLEAPIGKLPPWGAALTSTILSYRDLKPAKDLLRIFDSLEDALHPYLADKSKRYAVLLQLLLLKIHDENSSRSNVRRELALQDFSAMPVSDREVARRMNAALGAALNHYQRYLPKKIDASFSVPPEGLRRATELLAPVKILESRADVIQKFYMKFAKDLYKWDLAQYFTPHEVIDFIVDVVNPQYGEHVKDPACGSADFLVSAFRSSSKQGGGDSSHSIWGSDNSEQAVQISILNMLLNGDGKTNIVEEDSLEKYSESSSRQVDVVLCNPPFGTKIVERRWEVLRKFDLGYAWEDQDGVLERTDDVLPSQQTGILFAELCVRLTRPGGRVGIILPNGYLGNSTARYVALREWLLRHSRLAGIASFPRFTFKKSGADVSASVVFLEVRDRPLENASKSKSYRFFVGMVESVGWRAGDKKGVPIYQRDPATGALILNEDNEPLLDTDFPEVFQEFLRSAAGDSFSWLRKGRGIPKGPQGWSIDIRDVVKSGPGLPLDPKRWCAKYKNLVDEIEARPHFRLGDVLDVVPEKNRRVDPSTVYRYVEIQNLGTGSYDYEELRGWQLPARARLKAESGDIFIAAIWGSAGKWCFAGKDSKNLLFTNGCVQTRIKKNKEVYLLDLVAGLCSEAFCVQMRAMATGSDGLAEIAAESLLEIRLPRITDQATRTRLSRVVEAFQDLDTRLDKAVLGILGSIKSWPIPPDRKSHCVLV